MYSEPDNYIHEAAAKPIVTFHLSSVKSNSSTCVVTGTACVHPITCCRVIRITICIPDIYRRDYLPHLAEGSERWVYSV